MRRKSRLQKTSGKTTSKKRTGAPATKKRAQIELRDLLLRLSRSLIGLRCWHVSTGSGDGTFQLALGAKMRRSRPLQSLAQPATYRRYEGAFNVLVWCSWRLSGSSRLLSSSMSEVEEMTSSLKRIVGKTVRDVRTGPPFWDLTMSFDGITLDVFSDYVGRTPDAGRNWELWMPSEAILVCSRGRLSFFRRRRAERPVAEDGRSR
jgi:hypothetical protein